MNLYYFLSILGLLINVPLAMGAITPSSDEGRPHEHFCPITLDVIQDPIVAADGYSYERAAIARHFGLSDKSPVTGVRIERTLIPNHVLKTMICDWKPGRHHDPNVLETRSAVDIVQRVKIEFARNKALLGSSIGKHIVAFLGNTGAGKSTLINFLAKKELIVSEDGEDYILAHLDDPIAMVIGTSGNSETLYPKFIDIGDLRFFDLPGFNDTDGSERNLVNAAFIRQILLGAASVRLVFVAGQDQFTADRSTSIRQMFTAIRQLFVTEGQGVDLVQEGLFVATKISCNESVDMINFLLKKTNSTDKEALNQQLQSWKSASRISCMFPPNKKDKNEGIRDTMLGLIRGTVPSRILGINVSALYPPETKSVLQRMFTNMMEEAFTRKLGKRLTTVSDYNQAIAEWTANGFWKTFDSGLCAEDESVGLLKEFSTIPYNRALLDFEKDNGKKHQSHIQALNNKKQERINDVQERTTVKTQETIERLVPRPESGNLIPFDFAYHKDFFDAVCGPDSITALATDPQEQDIVRQCYAELICYHSHQQMMTWMQQFSGMTDISRRLVLLETKERQRETAAAPVQQETTVSRSIAIPEIARGHEEFYRRFLNGKLIYKPDPNSDAGRIEMPFSALANPLEGTFDLSRCGNTGQHLSISTGYRKAKNPANANKIEIWFVPRFLIEKELGTTAVHFGPIMGNWNAATAPLGLFWTWGGWDRLDYYDYLTTQTTEQIRVENLLLNYNKSGAVRRLDVVHSTWCRPQGNSARAWIFQCFYVN